MSKIEIVFDGPPGPKPGRFVEVEKDGRGVSRGRWVEDDDRGFWKLEMLDPEALKDAIVDLLSVGPCDPCYEAGCHSEIGRCPCGGACHKKEADVRAKARRLIGIGE